MPYIILPYLALTYLALPYPPYHTFSLLACVRIEVVQWDDGNTTSPSF